MDIFRTEGEGGGAQPHSIGFGGVIDPKGYFLCDFNKVEGYVFEKN